MIGQKFARGCFKPSSWSIFHPEYLCAPWSHALSRSGRWRGRIKTVPGTLVLAAGL